MQIVDCFEVTPNFFICLEKETLSLPPSRADFDSFRWYGVLNFLQFSFLIITPAVVIVSTVWVPRGTAPIMFLNDILILWICIV